MRRENLARFVVSPLVAAALIFLAWGWWGRAGWVDVQARMPEYGGWTPANLHARVGEPLRLRLTSEDVTHSFAIGQSDFTPVDITPGKPAEVTLTFDESGTYTFYCTRWCGPNHWRMRGTISVTGDDPAPADVEAAAPPLYLKLGIDLDAERETPDLPPGGQPSSERGASLGLSLPPLDTRSRSPYQVWRDLHGEPATAGLTGDERWDLVAWLWEGATTPAALAEGAALYQRDCAACHGVSGAGDGVFGKGPDSGNSDPAQTESAHATQSPTAFTDPAKMLTASPALLQGKILRGGMGTGMPSWGLIYTEEQTWALVDYLWTFQFRYAGGSE